MINAATFCAVLQKIFESTCKNAEKWQVLVDSECRFPETQFALCKRSQFACVQSMKRLLPSVLTNNILCKRLE